MSVRDRSDRSGDDGWRHEREDGYARSDQPLRRAEARRSDDPSPEDLERLVAMLARRETAPDDRLSRALEGLARWTENAKATVQEPARPAAQPAPRQDERREPARASYSPDTRQDDRQGFRDDGARRGEAPGVPDELQSRLTDYARSVGGRERPDSRPAPTPPIASLRSALAEIAARQKTLDDREDRYGSGQRDATPRAYSPAYEPRDPALAPRREPEPRRRETRADPRGYVDSMRDEEPRRPAPQPARENRYRPEPRAYAPRQEAPAPRVDAVPPRVFQELRSELERIGGAVSGLPTRAEIDHITREMTQIAARLGQDRPARLDRDSLSAIDSLVAEVDRMRTGAASPQVIAQLAEEVNAITARLDVLGPRNASAIDALARRIEDVRAELDRFPRIAALEGVASEIQSVIARLDAQERAAVPTREAVVGLSGHVLALDDRIAAIAEAASAREDAIERINSELRAELDTLPRAEAVFDLGRQIDALTEGLQSRSAIGPALKAVEGLSGKVDALDGKIADIASRQGEEAGWFADAVRGEIQAVARPAAIEGLGRQIEALTLGLIEHRKEPSPALDAINHRMSSIDERLEGLAAGAGDHRETFGRIEEVVRRFANDRQQPAADVEILVDKIDGLGERVESMASATRARGASFDRIEESVRSIAEQLLASRGAPGAEPSHALEAEVVRIVDKLEQNEERIEDLHAAFSGVAARIERSCADLGTHAAESAVAAARQALGPETRSPSSQLEDEIARALDDLRASTVQSERRSAETLEAVRDTLDRLLDRIPEKGAYPAPTYSAPAEPAPRRTTDAPVFETARKAAMFDSDDREPEPEQPRMPRADAMAAFSQAQAELSPDYPIEPGSGGVRGEQAAAPTAASFIAAARRAAAQPVIEDDPIAEAREKTAAPGRLSGALAALKARRRPLLLGLAAALVVLAALYVASGMTGQQEEQTPEPAPQSRLAPIDEPKVSALDARPEARDDAATTADLPKDLTAPNLPDDVGRRSASRADLDPAPAVEPKPLEPAVAKADAGQPSSGAKKVAEVAPPRAPARDLTSFAFSQSPASAAKGAEWKVGDPVTTGSIARASTELPDKIGGPTLRMRAVSGDPSAQLEVADRLLEGRNVEANPASAALWLEKAAGQGLAPAQQRLASLYEKGRGVTRDINAARRLYEQAAASGNVRAMHNLGVIHAEGGLGKPDFNAATIWFRMAAERGLVDSQYNLAVLEVRGLGGRRDMADAYKWFALAANQGDDDAGKKRDEVGKALGAKLSAAKAEADAFKPKQVDAAANEVPSPPGGWDRAGDKRASAQPR